MTTRRSTLCRLLCAAALAAGLAACGDDTLLGIAQMADEGAAAVPELAEKLDSGDWKIRREAAFALGRIGAPARPAVPALTRALTDPHEDVRVYAAFALGTAGDTTAVGALQAALEGDASPNVRRVAAAALGEFGAPASASAAALLTALSDDAAGVRQAAAEALGRIGEPADAIVPALIRAMVFDDDRTVRDKAAGALNLIATPEALAATASFVAGGEVHYHDCGPLSKPAGPQHVCQ